MLHILVSIFLLLLLHPVSPAAVPAPVAAPAPASVSLSKRAPQQLYGLGLFAYEASGAPIVALDNGVQFYFQNSDSNAVVYQNGVPKWYNAVHEGAGCDNGNNCFMAFQQDGNWVSYYNGVATWQSGTVGRGQYLSFFAIEPYVVIYDINLNPVWTSSGIQPAPATGVYNYCDHNAQECTGVNPTDGSWYTLWLDFGL